ncbi:MAG TPA: ABC transporter permease [Planctomycetota bacterium]|nr:ABC transporter permease [Planctomycetota bacterium]
MTSGSAPFEKTYSAETARHGLLANLLPVVGYPLDMWRHRYIIGNFFRRELLGRFRGSALGLFWVLVHPIFLFVIYYLVFGYLFGKAGTEPSKEFALYLFSGVIGFSSLNEGITRSCTCVVDNGNLVKKVAFPSQLLPVPVLLVALMVYVVGCVVCIAFGWWVGVLQPGWSLLLLPVVLLIQFAMMLGLGMFLANAQVFARDTSHLWGILSMAWMFLTPVFWWPFQLEQSLGTGLQVMLSWNPAYPLIQAQRLILGARDGVVDGHPIAFGELGEHLVHAGGWALVFLIVGHAVFMSRRHKFADLV